MTGKKDIDQGYCLYGARSMLTLLSALSEEIEGVKSSDDIEYIHRCRVATRRLRATLSVFEKCFSRKNFKKFRNNIRTVTRALGEARDADVQIAFLKSFLSGIHEHGDHCSLFALEGPGGSIASMVAAETSIIPVKTDDLSSGEECRFPLVEKLKKAVSGFFVRRVLKSQQKKETFAIPPGYGENVPGFASGGSLSLGLNCMITRLEQKRRGLQPAVIGAMEELEKSGTVDDMSDLFHGIIVEGEMYNTDIHSPFSYEKAFYNISVRMEELFWFERFISEPEQIARHHAMRIAAKRLRYTMEIYAGLYDGELKDYIKSFKRLQDILGDLHDCDVWKDYIDQFSKEERERSLEYFGNHAFFNLLIPGIEYLKSNRITERKRLFEELNEYWKECKREHLWDGIRHVISLPLQSNFNRLIDSFGGDSTLKIAFVGGVYANLPALEAVIRDAKERGAAVLVNTGDLVGHGGFPDEVVSLIRKEHAINVIGNYDLSVLRHKKSKKSLPKKRFKKFAIKWTFKQLSGDNRFFLGSLPRHLTLDFRGQSVYVAHGTPDSVNGSINRKTAEKKLIRYAEKTGSDVVVTGHSSEPFAKKAGNTWFVNTGSVGMPGDGDPRACYALLSLNPFSLYHIRVPYDVQRAVDRIYENKLSGSFARIFREGQPVDLTMHADEEKKQS